MEKKKKIAKTSFGDKYFSNTDSFEELEVETFETIKNGVKTIITCKFNKEGYLVSFVSTSENPYPFIAVKQKPTKGRFIKRRG